MRLPENNEARATRMAAVLSESPWAKATILHELDDAAANLLEAIQYWTPVEERLPEEGTICLVTLEDGSLVVAKLDDAHPAGVLWIAQPEEDIPNSVGVIAWQPLPARYQP